MENRLPASSTGPRRWKSKSLALQHAAILGGLGGDEAELRVANAASASSHACISVLERVEGRLNS